jgi:acyl carrier protein
VTFEIVRTVFSVIIFVTFLNILITGIAYGKEGEKRKVVFEKVPLEIDAATFVDNVTSKSGIREDIQEVVAKICGIKSSEITDDCHLMKDLGADSLDVVDIQNELEQLFEVGEIAEEEIKGKLKICDLVELFYPKILGKPKIPNEIPTDGKEESGHKPKK